MDNDSFNPLNRLMEFGLGMGVAQQMMNTMNVAMANMTTPGVERPLNGGGSQTYALVDNEPAGPLSEVELKALIANGRLTGQSLVWQPGLTEWTMAAKVPAVNKWLLLAAPPAPKNPNNHEG